MICQVAPYMGAWIEIAAIEPVDPLNGVAPYMGAWIEIYVNTSDIHVYHGRSLHGSVD